MNRLLHSFLPGVVACTVAFAAGAEWLNDFEVARERAVREDKDLLLDFTGTDWCAWCIRLKREVFEQANFEAYAEKHLVLVELDFPRTRELDPELAAQNRRLAEEMAVNGYPTVILCDAEGRIYARTGYRPGGAAPYIEHLEGLRRIRQRRDEAFARAASLGGVEKAGELLKGLGCMDPDLADLAYGGVVAEILRLDPEDTLGFAAARREVSERDDAMAARTELLKTFFTGTIRPMIEREAFGELEEALSDFLAKHPELPGMNRQVLIFNVGLARFRADRNHEAMRAVIDRLAREFPESEYAKRGTEMKKNLGRYLEGGGPRPAEE